QGLPEGASLTLDSASSGKAKNAAEPHITSGRIESPRTAATAGTYAAQLPARSSAGLTAGKVTMRVVAPGPHIDDVANAASLNTSLACSPGSLAMVRGTDLDIPAKNGKTAPDTRLNINGAPVQILWSSDTQLVF